MNIFKRIKNLWRLSAYEINDQAIRRLGFYPSESIKKELAKIVAPKEDFFKENDSTP